jgi:hypothetical protein
MEKNTNEESIFDPGYHPRAWIICLRYTHHG